MTMQTKSGHETKPSISSPDYFTDGLRKQINSTVKAMTNLKKERFQHLPSQATSMDIFEMFVTTDENGLVDASGILSKECYNAWLKSRKTSLKNPHLTFVQSVRGHVAGTKDVGRNPMPPGVEASLLRLIRQKKIWPCFEGTKAKYGSRGMKITGYHERQRTTEHLEQYSTQEQHRNMLARATQPISHLFPGTEARYLQQEIGGIEASLSHSDDRDLGLALEALLVDEAVDYSRKRASTDAFLHYSYGANKRQTRYDDRVDNATIMSLIQRRESFC
eukprot:CAMPEP_0203752870 /NCGR_PEP_ID=MMETSP0098-20131031/6736_1 /ASSEMBLY_ACC=CAM_ASM_000208 /TAXON_ID=96639 /ORGANISM=" , Strain NY0313808BC1" /LENGTH=275 /DNA_ID=CAMNT_0050643237 /DNA_START=24 /DNA_END=851 /DNA_ORIENTATION=-